MPASCHWIFSYCFVSWYSCSDCVGVEWKTSETDVWRWKWLDNCLGSCQRWAVSWHILR